MHLQSGSIFQPAMLDYRSVHVRPWEVRPPHWWLWVSAPQLESFSAPQLESFSAAQVERFSWQRLTRNHPPWRSERPCGKKLWIYNRNIYNIMWLICIYDESHDQYESWIMKIWVTLNATKKSGHKKGRLWSRVKPLSCDVFTRPARARCLLTHKVVNDPEKKKKKN